MFFYYFKFHNLLFITILIIFKVKIYDFNTNYHTQRFYTNVSAMRSFRFRDFEPRYTIKNDADMKPIIYDRLIRNIRKPRGFQFHVDEEDFDVELEFIIPFIQIPLERSMTVTQTAFRSLFNLNLQSLITTGAVIAIGGIIALILKIFFTQFVYISNFKKISRNEDAQQMDSILLKQLYDGNNTENITDINKFAFIIESKFKENDIDLRHCIQRSLCTYAKHNFGKADSNTKGLSRIMEGVLSLDFMRNYLRGTAVKDALDMAKNGDNCAEIYDNCNWPTSMKNLLNLFLLYNNGRLKQKPLN
ncbi:uncharacterized protein ACRADG_007599 [Cochliomyia hominivorax]